VSRDGATLVLPPSKKTRALLGYLVATSVPQSRQRLCDLLWDGPDDPRAALRWSLTKLRPLLDERGVARLVADRERVGFEPLGAHVDLSDAVVHAGRDVASADLDALRRASDTLCGDFLEGLDLPDCYRFHEWCTGQRERVRALRLSVLDALVDRLVDASPEEALNHARERLTVDPLSDVAHAAVVKLLARLGRKAEAHAQVEACRRILERELGGRRSPALEIARAEIGRGSAPPPATTATPAPGPARRPAVSPSAPASLTIVGRALERSALEDFVSTVRSGGNRNVLLLSGEPGIGKSRLLEEVASLARADGANVLHGRAFEAEAVRPFGLWVDLLREAVAAEVDQELRRHLAPLFPELGESHRDAESRARLFGGIDRLLRDAAARAPVLLVIDDLHWLDEASSGLLHYVARVTPGARVGFACAARAGELDDNPSALRFVRALRRDGRLLDLVLAPLDEAEVGALLRAAGTGDVDSRSVFREGGGNPLLSLEMGRALAAGEENAPRAIEDLVHERLARLDPRARDLVLWAAALGREFDPESLAAIAGETLAGTVAAFGDLEHHGLVTSAATRYAFTHELIRKAVYRQLSGPRRRLVHLTIARALAAGSDDVGIAWGDVVHHASLAEDATLVATACVAAGDRALRMLARRPARDFAARGLAQTARLGLAGLERRVDLLRIAALSMAMNPERQAALEENAEDAVRVARDNGRPDLAARALFALGFLRNERGDFEGAHEYTRHAPVGARAIPPAEAVPALANAGFCLAIIERELPRARALLDEATETARVHGFSIVDIELCDGFLAHLDGNVLRARVALDRGLALSRAQGDGWREGMALIRQTMMAIESGSWAAAHAHAAELRDVAKRVGGEGSEGAIADAFDALALRGEGAPEGAAKVDAAIRALELADAKVMLAYVLTAAAEQEIRRGELADAKLRAEAALAAAEPMGKPSAIVLARVALGRCAAGGGDVDAVHAHLARARELLEHPYGVSKRARDAVSELAALSNVSSNAVVHARSAILDRR